MKQIDEQELRDRLRLAYIDHLFDEGLLNEANFDEACENILRMIDDLVSVEDENGNVTFYGINGTMSDPKNIAAVYTSEAGK